MTNIELLLLIGGARENYIQAAEETRKDTPRKQKAPVRKFLLIAAVIAAILVFAGCVALALGLRERTLAEIPVSQGFDVYGNTEAEPEKTWNVASLMGYQNSPIWKASQEWTDFERSYDPGELDNDPNHPEIPDAFEYTYHCYDLTMAQKVQEIAEKYDLKLLGTRAVAQSWQREAGLAAIGLDHLAKPGIPADFGIGALRIHPPYNFTCDTFLTLKNDPWQEEILAEVHYLKADYLSPEDTFVYDPASTREWQYITSDGEPLLLALWGRNGLILSQNEDRSIAITLDFAWQSGVFLDEAAPLPEAASLEAVAECFDFSITTQAAPMEGLEEALNTLPDPYAQEGGEFVPQEYDSFADYITENISFPWMMTYTFYDVDKDGQQDLILAYGDGFSDHWLSIRDGKVMNLTGGRSPMRLCEGGIVEFEPQYGGHFTAEITGADPEVGVKLSGGHTIEHRDGIWTIDGQECTRQEAVNLEEKWIPLELPWKPLMDFPMDEKGTTLYDLLKQNPMPSEEALISFYREHAKTDQIGELHQFDFYYELRDVNWDGVKDLLISVDGVHVHSIDTYDRGKVKYLAGNYFEEGYTLCQGDILEERSKTEDWANGKMDRIEYFRLYGDRYSIEDVLFHHLSTDTWTDAGHNPITPAEAQAIQGKHPPESLHWRPIQELLGS